MPNITEVRFLLKLLGVVTTIALSHILTMPLVRAEGLIPARSTQEAPNPQGLPDLVGIARTIAPSVVNISVKGTKTISTSGSDSAEHNSADEPDAIQELMRQFQNHFGGLPATIKVPIHGEGSGLIVRANGIILTNAHVISNAQFITDERLELYATLKARIWS